MPSIFDEPSSGQDDEPVIADPRAGDQVRVGQADRDAAIATLASQFSQGRLSADELRSRSAAASGARTRGDLRAVLEGLPAGGFRLGIEERLLQIETARAEQASSSADQAMTDANSDTLAKQLFAQLVAEALEVMKSRNTPKMLEVEFEPARFLRPRSKLDGIKVKELRVAPRRVMWAGQWEGQEHDGVAYAIADGAVLVGVGSPVVAIGNSYRKVGGRRVVGTEAQLSDLYRKADELARTQGCLRAVQVRSVVHAVGVPPQIDGLYQPGFFLKAGKLVYGTPDGACVDAEERIAHMIF